MEDDYVEQTCRRNGGKSEVILIDLFENWRDGTSVWNQSKGSRLWGYKLDETA